MKLKARYVGRGDSPLPAWGKAAGVKRGRWVLFLQPSPGQPAKPRQARQGERGGATIESR